MRTRSRGGPADGCKTEEDIRRFSGLRAKAESQSARRVLYMGHNALGVVMARVAS